MMISEKLYNGFGILACPALIVVTLIGEVTCAAERQRAVAKAKEVDGERLTAREPGQLPCACA